MYLLVRTIAWNRAARIKERLEEFPPEDHLAYYCTLFRRERG